MSGPSKRWLRFHLLVRTRRERGRVRGWLARHPRFETFLTRSGSLQLDEYAVARGVAMGLLVGLTPTVGAQTLLMLAGAILFRANFIAAYLVSFVSNPLTMAPLYIAFHELGELVLTWLPMAVPQVGGLEERLIAEVKAMLIGSLLIALPIAGGGYALALWGWRRRLQRRQARKQQPGEFSDRTPDS